LKWLLGLVAAAAITTVVTQAMTNLDPIGKAKERWWPDDPVMCAVNDTDEYTDDSEMPTSPIQQHFHSDEGNNWFSICRSATSPTTWWYWGGNEESNETTLRPATAAVEKVKWIIGGDRSWWVDCSNGTVGWWDWEEATAKNGRFDNEVCP
jgi:hypothetical protein